MTESPLLTTRLFSDPESSLLLQGQSLAPEPDRAVADLQSAMAGAELALVLFFCSSRFDLPRLAHCFRSRFAGTPLIGCTTAGEIGPAGYRDGSVAAIGFSAAGFSAASTAIGDLDAFDELQAREMAGEMMRRVGRPAEQCFSILLIDGLSGREERVARQCQRALGNVALVGGSAGDDQCFVSTSLFHKGEFRDEALWLVIGTALAFKVYRSSHFVGCSEPLVVTEADAERRIVREINGYLAAEEYSRITGVPVAYLDPVSFAKAPFTVRIGGNDYVRSIRTVQDDGSLSLYCAIERGVVLRVAAGMDLAGVRRKLFEDLRRELGKPLGIVGFDCIHCRLEAENLDGKAAIEDMFRENRVVGFSSYGEQFVGTHVNQTFTGVAIGAARRHG